MRHTPALRRSNVAVFVHIAGIQIPVLHDILHGTHSADGSDIVACRAIGFSGIIHTSIHQLLRIVGIFVRRCLDIGINLGFQRFCGLVHFCLIRSNGTVGGIHFLRDISHILRSLFPMKCHLLREPGTHRPVFLLRQKRSGRHRFAADIAVTRCFLIYNGQRFIFFRFVPNTIMVRNDTIADIFRHIFLLSRLHQPFANSTTSRPSSSIEKMSFRPSSVVKAR